MSLESQTILLAISAAFVSAATNITFAPALRQMGSFALAQFNNLGNTLMLGVIGFWLYEPGSFRWEAFAWFGVLGVMNYSINRWVFYTGMNIVGPARHITITSMVPLPSLFLAVIFLGEEPGLWVLFGTLLVVLGIAAVSYEPSGGRVVPRRHRLVAHEHAHAGGQRVHAKTGNVVHGGARPAHRMVGHGRHPHLRGFAAFPSETLFPMGLEALSSPAGVWNDHQRADANPHQPLLEG